MPHFTQKIKKEFKKSKFILFWGYLAVVFYLFWVIKIYTLLDEPLISFKVFFYNPVSSFNLDNRLYIFHLIGFLSAIMIIFTKRDLVYKVNRIILLFYVFMQLFAYLITIPFIY